MTILYRTPNLILADHEWHAAVEMHHGRIARYFRFRPNTSPKRKWQDVTAWPGHKPTWREFDRVFRPFKRHMLLAERSVVENGRREAA